jgi:hypothetical protein
MGCATVHRPVAPVELKFQRRAAACESHILVSIGEVLVKHPVIVRVQLTTTGTPKAITSPTHCGERAKSVGQIATRGNGKLESPIPKQGGETENTGRIHYLDPMIPSNDSMGGGLGGEGCCYWAQEVNVQIE